MPPRTRRRNDEQPSTRCDHTGHLPDVTRATAPRQVNHRRAQTRDLKIRQLRLKSMLRRTAPASRPSGRYAVGLRPSLDPRALIRRAPKTAEAPEKDSAEPLTGPAPSGMTCADGSFEGLTEGGKSRLGKTLHSPRFPTPHLDVPKRQALGEVSKLPLGRHWAASAVRRRRIICPSRADGPSANAGSPRTRTGNAAQRRCAASGDAMSTGVPGILGPGRGGSISS